MANLFIRYANIINTKDVNKSIFIQAVYIPTNSQSCTQKQHLVPQALETDIDAEMKYMATESIIESCIDPKGFNSPIFDVHKKNG